MQIKVYLGDWFFNAGIIGFLNILEHAEKDYVVKRDNYIHSHFLSILYTYF